jgi:hypothetical protein
VVSQHRNVVFGVMKDELSATTRPPLNDFRDETPPTIDGDTEPVLFVAELNQANAVMDRVEPSTLRVAPDVRSGLAGKPVKASVHVLDRLD